MKLILTKKFLYRLDDACEYDPLDASYHFFRIVFDKLIFYMMRRNDSNRDFSAIFLRVKTWWGMLVIFALAILFNPIVSLISLMVLCFFFFKGVLLHDED
jgi:predicted CDP-diglyceride synthetase/phosphatidate cytidylyltransferase